MAIECLFESRRGLRQSDRLSCLLINIVLEGVMRRAGYDFQQIQTICLLREMFVLQCLHRKQCQDRRGYFRDGRRVRQLRILADC